MPKDERRKVLSREFLQPLKEAAARARGSLSMTQAARAMMPRQKVKTTLGELRMAFKTRVRPWPDFRLLAMGQLLDSI